MIESPDFVAFLPPPPAAIDDVLPAVDHVDARRRVAAGRQLMLPEHRPECFSNARIFSSAVAAMKITPPAVATAPPKFMRAGVADALRDELRVLAERDLPEDLALDEIDRVQRAPGRRDGRHAVRIEEHG